MSEIVAGRISQIIGPVVDVFFDLQKKDEEKLPAIHDALYIPVFVNGTPYKNLTIL